MKLGGFFIGLAAATAFDKDVALEKAMEAYDVRNSWEDGFVIYAQMLMADTTDKCVTLKSCVNEMEAYFQKFIMDDKTNTYVTVAWCGTPEDASPDGKGNVWWYDGWDNKVQDKPYYVIDAVERDRTTPCGTQGMIMRGIEVDISISIYAAPDYIHTKWDIAHKEPQFDYTKAHDCEDFNGVGNSYCAKANPCGKADELYTLWNDDVMYQLRGNKAHMVLSMCHKGGDWKDSSMKDPDFPESVNGLAAARLFEPIDFSNTIYDHIEWDKAPRDSELGDGEGWEPFKFSQCCSTVVIAPQI